MNKLHAAFVPLLAVAAFVVAPAVAQAEPYWTSNGKVIPEGQLETVSTSGALAFNMTGTTIKCKVKDQETIENPVGGGPGVDHMTAFSTAGCAPKPAGCLGTSKPEVIAHLLAWTTELIPGPPIRDEIKGMELEVKCSNNTVLGKFTGALTPAVGASVLEFGTGSGQLTEGAKPLTVTGNDKMTGPMADTKIGAEEVEHEPHWYSNGTRLAEGTPEGVATSGNIVLSSGPHTVKCKLADHETIENPVGGGAGVDEMTAFELAACKGAPSPCPPKQAVTVLALGLPWSSELIAGSPITDEIEGIELEVRCKNVFLDLFEGTLAPNVGNSKLEFGAGTGELEDGGTNKMTVTSIDKLKGPPGDTKITALDP